MRHFIQGIELSNDNRVLQQRGLIFEENKLPLRNDSET